jgi:hypothetical protein
MRGPCGGTGMVVAGGLLGCVNQSTWRKQLICPNEIQLLYTIFDWDTVQYISVFVQSNVKPK